MLSDKKQVNFYYLNCIIQILLQCSDKWSSTVVYLRCKMNVGIRVELFMFKLKLDGND